MASSGDNSDDSDNLPSPRTVTLTVLYSPEAQQELLDGAKWLAGVAGTEAGARLLHAVKSGVDALAEQLTERLSEGQGVPPPQDLSVTGAAQLVDGWPLRRLTVVTGKKKSSSGSGTWQVFYLLPDNDGDGIPETIAVVAVRHARALPPGADKADA